VTWWAGPTTYWTDNTATTRYGTLNMAAVKSAIKLMVGHLWSNRDASTETALSQIPFGVTSLLGTRSTYQ
jgi:hypothetical protein